MSGGWLLLVAVRLLAAVRWQLGSWRRFIIIVIIIIIIIIKRRSRINPIPPTVKDRENETKAKEND